MAIKRMDPRAVFKVISASDEALLNETAEELVSEDLDANGQRIIKASRYDKYIEEANLDESVLIFKEGQKPDRFVLRTLTADEQADINSKFVFVDTVNKKVVVTDKNKMFLHMFRLAYQGLEIQTPEGPKVEKVPESEIPFQMQVQMGAVTSLIGTLGKNLKK